MKNSLVLLLCLTCSIVTWAQNTPQKNGVNFVNESITTILQPNNNAQKPVMVFVWTSDIRPVILPSFYFYSPKGKYLTDAVGYKSPQEILQLAKLVLDSAKRTTSTPK